MIEIEFMALTELGGALKSTDYKEPQKIAIPLVIKETDGMKKAIPVSFANAEIKSEIDVEHCLSAEGPAKEGMKTHQTMNRVVIPVITSDRADKNQNGRRFKENGDESFTLTSQDRHGVAIGVQMSGHTMKENNGISNCLNANDNRKIFGANQERTMAAVKIKEATKQGYAIARGGEMRSISRCREVRQEEDESG